MTLVRRKPKAKVELDLDGPEGNAWVLLGHAHRICNQVGMDFGKVEAEMTSGNYRHLVEVFDRYFGSAYEIILPSNWDEGGVLAALVMDEPI